MTEPGKHTFKEIMSQPKIWAEVLDLFVSHRQALTEFWQNGRFEQVIFTGCGSTYYLSLTAATMFQESSGISSQARPASEVVLFPEHVFMKDKNTLLVTISRSGETTETVEAIQKFKNSVSGNVLTISTKSDSRVAKLSDFVLSCDSAEEESIAQTRSFTSMLLLAQAFCAQVAGYDAYQVLSSLPRIIERLLEKYHDLARELGGTFGIERFSFLGSGIYYGVAQEAMLKMKEMSLSNSEAFHVLEFRHGPMSMVDNNSLIIGLISEGAASQEREVLSEMHALNGRILSVVESSTSSLSELGPVIELDSGLPAWARPVLYLPVLQLLAFYRAISQGQDPDNPANLDAVVKLQPLTFSS